VSITVTYREFTPLNVYILCCANCYYIIIACIFKLRILLLLFVSGCCYMLITQIVTYRISKHFNSGHIHLIRILTSMCSGSCHKCQNIHHHISPPTHSAKTLMCFGCGGGGSRYDHLKEKQTLLKIYYILI
jgi:hypothetical protein